MEVSCFYMQLKDLNIKNFFTDKDGKKVIAQFPNWPLRTAFVFFLLKYIPDTTFRSVSIWGVRVSLLYWAFLEIVSGVNLWRRFLGIAVAGVQAMQIISAF
jgi:hypothetical protein